MSAGSLNSGRPLVLLLAAFLAAPLPLVGQGGMTAQCPPCGGGAGVTFGQMRNSVLGVVSGTLDNVFGLSLSLEADVEVEPAALVGGVVGVRVAPDMAVRVRVARGSTQGRITARTSTAGVRQTFTYRDLGRVRLTLLDAELYWLPMGAGDRVTPYLIGGVGASNWTIDGLEDLGALPPLVESPVRLPPTNPWLPGAVGGVGVSLLVQGGVTARVEVSDHVSGNPWRDEDFRLGSTFQGTAAPKDLVHTVMLTAGLHVALGG